MSEKNTSESINKLSHWLEQDDINVISQRYQDDSIEKETETEIETETKREKKAIIVATPEGVSQSVWDDFVKHRKAKRAQVTQTVIEGIRKEAHKAGWSLDEALSEIIVRNWQSFKAEWVVEKMSKSAQTNSSVMQGLTRGLIGGGSNVKLLGN